MCRLIDNKNYSIRFFFHMQAYSSHSLYAIERWLTKYQILHPKGPILGFCSGLPVYPRSCVQTLKTKSRWLREGLQVKINEHPAKVWYDLYRASAKFSLYKYFPFYFTNEFELCFQLFMQVIKSSVKKLGKVQDSEADYYDCSDSKENIELYGKWQVEPLDLPHAVNGIVPKVSSATFY